MADDQSDTRPISMSVTGPQPVVLPPEPPALHDALDNAIAADEPAVALRSVVGAHPTSLFGWAALGDAESDPTLRYACYRVGYHRGLDALRANGWRGAGDVRWAEPTNRGFLRALLGLHLMSREIGDSAEADRTLQFLYQLDRTGAPQAEVDAIAQR